MSAKEHNDIDARRLSVNIYTVLGSYALVIVAVGFLFNIQNSQQAMAKEISDIHSEVKAHTEHIATVESRTDPNSTWSLREQRSFAKSFQHENPGIVVPDPDDIKAGTK